MQTVLDAELSSKLIEDYGCHDTCLALFSGHSHGQNPVWSMEP